MRKKIKSNRSPLAQSRIDYITFGNPGEVRKLITRYGYEPPSSLADLSDAVKELIRQEGKKVVADLVQLHPDKEAILSVVREPVVVQKESGQQLSFDSNKEVNRTNTTGCSSCGKATKTEDNFCGCSHAYDGQGKDEDDTSKLSEAELLQRYENLSKKDLNVEQSKEAADEVTRIWNELRKRNGTGNGSNGFTPLSLREILLILSLTIMAGVFIGMGVQSFRSTLKAAQ